MSIHRIESDKMIHAVLINHFSHLHRNQLISSDVKKQKNQVHHIDVSAYITTLLGFLHFTAKRERKFTCRCLREIEYYISVLKPCVLNISDIT